MTPPPGVGTPTAIEPLKIGDVHVPHGVWLAPMSGVTDAPFRALASRFGAGLVVCEMIASEALVSRDSETLSRAETQPSSHGPHVIQLAGREAHWMAEGARIATDLGADIIDINMGCPAKQVTKGASGSALMRDLDHALTLIEATVAATTRPVTVKMRLGWDDATRNAPELAARAADAGVQAITVHGRTRCQFYKGHADWPAVAAVRSKYAGPLVVNGDITDDATARTALQRSGANAVMVGRGAYGAPWAPGTIGRALGLTVPGAPPRADWADLIGEHFEAMLALYGREKGRRNARKHLAWYVETARFPAPRAAHWRRVLCGTDDVQTVRRMIGVAFAEAAERAAEAPSLPATLVERAA